MQNREKQNSIVENRQSNIKNKQLNLETKKSPKFLKSDLSLLNSLQKLSPTNITLSRVLRNGSFVEENKSSLTKNHLM